MSASKWSYDPDSCDGHYCPGDCDLCSVADKLDEQEEIRSKYERLVNTPDYWSESYDD